MRQSCQIAVYVDLPRASKDGILFYRSANGVILTEGLDGILPPCYIEKIWHIRKREWLGLRDADDSSAHPSPSSHSPSPLPTDSSHFALAEELRCALWVYR